MKQQLRQNFEDQQKSRTQAFMDKFANISKQLQEKQQNPSGATCDDPSVTKIIKNYESKIRKEQQQ